MSAALASINAVLCGATRIATAEESQTARRVNTEEADLVEQFRFHPDEAVGRPNSDESNSSMDQAPVRSDGDDLILSAGARLRMSADVLNRPVARSYVRRLRALSRTPPAHRCHTDHLGRAPTPETIEQRLQQEDQGSSTSSSKQQATLPLNHEDLIPLLRLGALQGDTQTALQQEHLPTHMDLGGIDLKWVCDPSRRPRLWRSIENGTVHESYDSPRSVLALLRCGLRRRDFAPVDEDQVRKRASIEGLSPLATENRIAFLKEHSRSALKLFVNEHARIVASISRKTIVEFIDAFIADGCDYARPPQITDVICEVCNERCSSKETQQRCQQCARSPRREVVMPKEDRVLDSMNAATERAAKELRTLKVRAAMEIEVRNRVTNAAQDRAYKAIEVYRRREEFERNRREDIAKETALFELIAKQRSKARQEVRSEQQNRLEERQEAREARSRALEESIEYSKRQRAHDRQARLLLKKKNREARAEAASESYKRLLEERAARVAASEAFGKELTRSRQEENARRQTEIARRTEENMLRRQMVKQRATLALGEARSRAERRQAEVEETLNEFHRCNSVMRDYKRVVDSVQTERRREKLLAATREEAERYEARLMISEHQQRRFELRRRERRNQRELDIERAREIAMSKRAFVDRHELAAEYQRYTTESTLAAKLATAVRIDDARSALVKQTASNRILIHNERTFQLTEAFQQRVTMERKAFFEQFRVLYANRSGSPAERSTSPSVADRAGIRDSSSSNKHPLPAPLEDCM